MKILKKWNNIKLQFLELLIAVKQPIPQRERNINVLFLKQGGTGEINYENSNGDQGLTLEHYN